MSTLFGVFFIIFHDLGDENRLLIDRGYLVSSLNTKLWPPGLDPWWPFNFHFIVKVSERALGRLSTTEINKLREENRLFIERDI